MTPRILHSKEEAISGMDLDELAGAVCQLVIGIEEKENGTFNVIENVTAVDEDE